MDPLPVPMIDSLRARSILDSAFELVQSLLAAAGSCDPLGFAYHAAHPLTVAAENEDDAEDLGDEDDDDEDDEDDEEDEDEEDEADEDDEDEDLDEEDGEDEEDEKDEGEDED